MALVSALLYPVLRIQKSSVWEIFFDFLSSLLSKIGSCEALCVLGWQRSFCLFYKRHLLSQSEFAVSFSQPAGFYTFGWTGMWKSDIIVALNIWVGVNRPFNFITLSSKQKTQRVKLIPDCDWIKPKVYVVSCPSALVHGWVYFKSCADTAVLGTELNTENEEYPGRKLHYILSCCPVLQRSTGDVWFEYSSDKDCVWYSPRLYAIKSEEKHFAPWLIEVSLCVFPPNTNMFPPTITDVWR